MRAFSGCASVELVGELTALLDRGVGCSSKKTAACHADFVCSDHAFVWRSTLFLVRYGPLHRRLARNDSTFNLDDLQQSLSYLPDNVGNTWGEM